VKHALLLFAWIGALLCAVPPSTAQLPPDARWYTFDTEHFRVHHTAELEPVARRAADRAEAAYRLITESFVAPPRGTIDLVVSDNVDFANGYATPFPTNRVVIFAHPPVDEPSLSFFDDWIELVVLHELVHIFHLDNAGGIWKPLRSVVGRSPYLFPQVLAPGWVIEGLATYYESRLTRAGRVRGTQHEMALRTAILEDGFFSIDRATGDPASWPGGSTRYIYGSLFLAHLAQRYGPDPITVFTETVGRRVLPYRLDAAARQAFGISFTRAWAEWQDTLRSRYARLADSLRAEGITEPEILTEAGNFAHFPRFSPAGGYIAYAAATGREEPSTRLILPSGRDIALARRTSLGRAAWFPDGRDLLLAQLQFQDPYRIYADLYQVDLDGTQRRLTRGARVWEPDVAPDGWRVVAVANASGSNVLVLVDPETGRTRPLVEPSLDVHWSLPRWSPAGDRIAAGRWRTGGLFDVVVLDSTGVVLREITADRAVDNAPAWSPDGRYVLFSSDRTGIANLFAFDLVDEQLLQVTNVLTGAFQPDVSPDGLWIAFSYYRSDGYHIARIPFDPALWRAASVPPADPGTPAAVAIGGTTVGTASRAYSPWPSLRPAGWSPLVSAGSSLGVGIGAGISGTDVVGRHRYVAEALVHPDGLRAEGGIVYRYRGWGNPVLNLSATQDWTVRAEARRGTTADGDTITSALLEREARGSASATYLYQRWRRAAWVGGGTDLRKREFVWDDPRLSGNPAARLLVVPPEIGALVFGGYSSARGYTFSISPEDGFTLSLTGEGRQYTRPFEGEATARRYLRVTGRGHAFQGLELGGFARHVVALRVTTGVETGSFTPGFSIGGESSTPVALGLGLGLPGTTRTFPLRGYQAGVQTGDRAVSASVEYRFPLFLIERGVRALPLFADRFSGSIFADAGTAWCTEDCARRVPRPLSAPRPLVSAGAELSLGLSLGFAADLLLRGGVAVPLRATAPGASAPPRPQLYFATGRSF
jgi:Tol biopolymer transport system component